MVLLLEFTVDLDTQKLGFLDQGDCLLAEVNLYYKYYIYTGKVDEFTLFQGKLYTLCSSLLAVGLLGTFKVSASLQYIFTEGQEVQVISKADYYKTSLVLKLGVETRGIEEKEDQ